MKTKAIKLLEGAIYHIDTDRVSQYEGTRIVDDVEVQSGQEYEKETILVYSLYLQANVLVPIEELKDRT